MKKLLFASLLTVAVVFAQAGGGTTDKKAPRTIENADKPVGDAKTKNGAPPLPVPPKRRNTKTIAESTHKSGSGGHVGGGSGAGKVSTAESTHAIGSATGGAGSRKTESKHYRNSGKTVVNKAGKQPPPKRPAPAPPAK